jgi:endonuclease YncB( thermonuclease family)
MLKEILLVISIIDGDTVKVLDHNNHQLRIRLASIDAPERGQPYGKKATELLSSMIGNKRVQLTCPKKDYYKRWICTIHYQGIDINKSMVEKGGAWVYRKYYSGKEYIASEDKAKANKIGLWSTSEYQAIPPWKWRKTH